MASRSFKPISYLASAQPSKPKNNHRPSFARTSSSSSTHSTKSDDSFIATFKTLSTTEKRDGELSGVGNSSSPSPRCFTPGNTSSRQSFFDDTPSRARSQPITIELPSTDRGAYTPLSARGDLPGGYFPNHETIQKQYKSQPFPRSRKDPEPEPSSPMSTTSSAAATPSDSTPKAPTLAFQSPTPIPTTLTMPMGKYHPSNYKIVSPSLSPAPTSAPIQPTALEIPQSKTNKRPNHERRTSDVKRKLQQYQRDMIVQARMASSSQGGRVKPDSPKLVPLGSPGPITPFELEESAGYLVAGARVGGLGVEKEREVVGRMIMDEERRISTRESGGSPVMI